MSRVEREQKGVYGQGTLGLRTARSTIPGSTPG